ncbi:hypothetical protein ACFL5O_09030 [Myxococcota bacterium]
MAPAPSPTDFKTPVLSPLLEDLWQAPAASPLLAAVDEARDGHNQALEDPAVHDAQPTLAGLSKEPGALHWLDRPSGRADLAIPISLDPGITK